MGTSNPMLSKMIQDAILKLCTQNMTFQNSLEIDGIICVSRGETTHDVVIKMHRTIVKPPDSLDARTPRWMDSAKLNAALKDMKFPKIPKPHPTTGSVNHREIMAKLSRDPPPSKPTQESSKTEATQSTTGGDFKADEKEKPSNKRKSESQPENGTDEPSEKQLKSNDDVEIKEEPIQLELEEDDYDDGDDGPDAYGGASWMGGDDSNEDLPPGMTHQTAAFLQSMKSQMIGFGTDYSEYGDLPGCYRVQIPKRYGEVLQLQPRSTPKRYMAYGELPECVRPQTPKQLELFQMTEIPKHLKDQAINMYASKGQYKATRDLINNLFTNQELLYASKGKGGIVTFDELGPRLDLIKAFMAETFGVPYKFVHTVAHQRHREVKRYAKKCSEGQTSATDSSTTETTTGAGNSSFNEGDSMQQNDTSDIPHDETTDEQINPVSSSHDGLDTVKTENEPHDANMDELGDGPTCSSSPRSANAPSEPDVKEKVKKPKGKSGRRNKITPKIRPTEVGNVPPNSRIMERTSTPSKAKSSERASDSRSMERPTMSPRSRSTESEHASPRSSERANLSPGAKPLEKSNISPDSGAVDRSNPINTPPRSVERPNNVNTPPDSRSMDRPSGMNTQHDSQSMERGNTPHDSRSMERSSMQHDPRSMERSSMLSNDPRSMERSSMLPNDPRSMERSSMQHDPRSMERSNMLPNDPRSMERSNMMPRSYESMNMPPNSRPGERENMPLVQRHFERPGMPPSPRLGDRSNMPPSPRLYDRLNMPPNPRFEGDRHDASPNSRMYERGNMPPIHDRMNMPPNQGIDNTNPPPNSGFNKSPNSEESPNSGLVESPVDSPNPRFTEMVNVPLESNQMENVPMDPPPFANPNQYMDRNQPMAPGPGPNQFMPNPNQHMNTNQYMDPNQHLDANQYMGQNQYMEGHQYMDSQRYMDPNIR